MTLVLLGVFFAVLGGAFGKWWLPIVPAVLGAIYALFSVAVGTLSQQDNPFLVLTILATAALAAGVFANTRLAQSA